MFFTLFCLSERKLQIHCLNDINKDIKPFEKEFYNAFNLANLPRGDLQFNGENCLGALGTGDNCPWGDCLGEGQLV